VEPCNQNKELCRQSNIHIRYLLQYEVLGIDQDAQTLTINVTSINVHDPLFSQEGRDGEYEVAKGDRIKAHNGVIIRINDIGEFGVDFRVHDWTAVPVSPSGKNGAVHSPEWMNRFEDNTRMSFEAIVPFESNIKNAKRIKVNFVGFGTETQTAKIKVTSLN